MSKMIWTALGWMWLWLAPWTPAAAAPVSSQGCSAFVNKECAHRVGDVVTFTVNLHTGETTIFVVTHDLGNVERVVVPSSSNDSRVYTVTVGVPTFRLHPRVWCKGFSLKDQDQADALEASVAGEIAAIQGERANHEGIRAMIRTLELALVVAIQGDDAATADSLVQQLEQLESEDSLSLGVIQEAQAKITGFYGQDPDAKSAILLLDLLAFPPKTAVQPEIPADPPGFTEVPEAQEENPGFRLVQNTDDDDADGNEDRDGSPVPGENDTGQVWWFYAKPVDVSAGMRIESATVRLGFWRDRTKTTAESLPKQVDAFYERKRIFIEGRLPSPAPRLETVTAVSQLSADCRDVVQGTVDALSDMEFAGAAGATPMNDGAANFQQGGNLNAGGGDRVFPDRNTPGGPLNDTVRVRATVVPARAGVRVFFKPYDVDDPSSAAAPIDDDPAQPDNHEDNRGNVGGNAEGELVGADGDGVASDETDAAGVAEVEFRVARQPGDNFRVVATLLRPQLGGQIVRHPDADAFVRNAGGNPLAHPGTAATAMTRQSPLLTVWRQLHLENDSMEPVIGNTVAGTIQAVRVRGRNATVEIDRVLLDENQYLTEPRGNALGQFVSGGVLYEVNASSAGAMPETVVADIPRGAAAPAVGAAFTLVDDDVNGVVPALPDWGLMAEKHRPAYIAVFNDEGGTAGSNSQTVPFDLNVEDGQVAAQVGFGQSTHGNRERDFWIVYTQSGFQGPLQEDFDPNDRAEVVSGPGRTTGDGRGSILFREQRRDVGTHYSRLTPAEIVLWEQAAYVHEVGHQWFLIDGTGGIMSRTTPDRRGATENFTNDHLHRMRSKRESPGVVD